MRSGRVESVNLAVVRTDAFTRVKSGRSGIDKRPARHPVRLEPGGVDGDTVCDTKNHGGPEQAVYAYSVDDLAFWARELGRPVGPGTWGRTSHCPVWTAPAPWSASAGRWGRRCLAAAGGRRELLPRIAPARDHLGPRGREWLDTVLAASGAGSGN